MEIYVACDVCGHRYVLSGDREGRNAKCKSCGVSFQVSDDNYYDPETSESDEPEEDGDDHSSSLTPLWDIASNVLHGAAGLVTFGILIWMGSLLFRSPQQAAADVASKGFDSKNSPSRSQVAPELHRPSQRTFPQPNFQPQPHAPFAPLQPPFAPPQVKPPRIPKSPPVTDGSIGWPTSEPEPSPPRSTPMPALPGKPPRFRERPR